MRGRGIQLRRAGRDDLPALAALERECFPDAPWSVAALRATVSDPDTIALVAEETDARTSEPPQAPAVLGWGAVLAAQGAGEADIMSVAVAEDARGQGVGRALLEELGRSAAARGAQSVFLEVRVDNPVAIRLYERAGFRPVGRRPRYYQPGDVDALLMRASAGAFREVEGTR